MSKLIGYFLASVVVALPMQPAGAQTLTDEMLWIRDGLQHGGRRLTMQSGSMQPTIRTGSTLIFPRQDVNAAPPRRGDIILFLFPNRPEVWVKRIIGLPGDTVSVNGGRVTVNGNALPLRPVPVPPEFKEPGSTPTCYDETVDARSYTVCLLQNYSTQPLRNMAERRVPEGYVFVLGDNRDKFAGQPGPHTGLRGNSPHTRA